MGIVGDTFVEISADAFLESGGHAPTGANAGTGWTLEVGVGGNQQLEARTGSSDAAMHTNLGNDQIQHTLQPDPLVNEYDVEITLNGVDSGDDSLWILGRWTASNNMYGVGWGIVGGGSGNLGYLYKNVVGVITEIAAEAAANPTTGTTWKFEVRDAAKKMFEDSTEHISDPDDAIKANGKVGLALGDTFSGGDDAFNSWLINTFLRTDVGGAPVPGAAIFPRTRSIVRL